MDGYAGRQCTECEIGYFGYPNCTKCECTSEQHTKETICDNIDGTCHCLEKFGGTKCESCWDEYYKYPDCEPCDCNTDNTVDESNVCGKEDGQCPCDREDKVTGLRCDACKPGYLLSKDINYCRIGKRYFDLCDEEQGNCNCHEGFTKPMDCEYCSKKHFDFYSNGTCQGKISIIQGFPG
jgi:laminin alpha 3/5